MAQTKSTKRTGNSTKTKSKKNLLGSLGLGLFGNDSQSTFPDKETQVEIFTISGETFETVTAPEQTEAATADILPAHLVAEINRCLVRLYAFHLNYGSRTVAYSNLRRDITQIATQKLTSAEFLHELYTVPFGEGDAPLHRVTTMIGNADRTMRRSSSTPEEVVERIFTFHTNLAAACEAGNVEDILLLL
jgi:hypothetical protein